MVRWVSTRLATRAAARLPTVLWQKHEPHLRPPGQCSSSFLARFLGKTFEKQMKIFSNCSICGYLAQQVCYRYICKPKDAAQYVCTHDHVSSAMCYNEDYEDYNWNIFGYSEGLQDIRTVRNYFLHGTKRLYFQLQATTLYSNTQHWASKASVAKIAASVVVAIASLWVQLLLLLR